MSALVNFFKRIYTYRYIIKTMAVQEIRKRYAGTLAGSVWFIINPLLTILVYWFVFSVGFRVRPVGDIPFIVVFSVGLIPWMTFSEILTTSTNAVTGNAHLVTKMVFPTEILPFVNLVASLIAHGVMLIILLMILFFNGMAFSLFNLQFFYYLFALSAFSIGLSWLFSAVNVFYRDTAIILGVIMNIWFWLTPIVWGIEMLPEQYQTFIKLNPMFYIVEGYKYSFIYHTPFWHNYRLGIYFWGTGILFFAIGGLVFRKLKSEFADVL